MTHRSPAYLPGTGVIEADRFAPEQKTKADLTAGGRALIDMISPVLGQRCSESICDALSVKFGAYRPKTIRHRTNNFARAIGWFASNPAIQQSFEESRKAGTIVGDAWELAFHAWASSERSRPVLPSTKSTNINNANATLRDLFEAGVAPSVARLKTPRRARSRSGRRKTLIEAITKDRAKVTQEHVRANLERIGLNYEFDPNMQVVLSDLISAAGSSSLDHAEVFELLRTENSRRLHSLRAIAEKAFLKWLGIYDQAQAMAQLADVDAADQFRNAMSFPSSKTPGGGSRRILLNRLFPTSDIRKAQANFIVVARDVLGGELPSQHQNPELYFGVVFRLGGMKAIRPMIGLHPQAVAAAMILHLIDTGANTSVTIGLTLDYEGPEESGYVTVTGIKRRPTDKVVIDTLPVNDHSVDVTTVQALRSIKEIFGKLRERLPQENRRDLFLISDGLGIRPITDDFLLDQTKELLVNSEFSALSLCPSYIRPTVLLDLALRNDGDQIIAQRVAQHESSQTTQLYSLRFPTRALYALKTREFQDLLELVVIRRASIESVFLRLSLNETNRRFERALRSGLGFWISEESEQQTALQPDRTRMIFEVSDDGLVEVACLQRELELRWRELEAQRSYRYENYWLPLRALVEVIFEKLSRSQHASRLLRAKDIARDLWIAGYRAVE